MAQKHIRVSLVIPAYNEEHHLRTCLDHIAAQAVLPYEVIIVDNNSTDSTRSIVEQYSWVRLLKEPRQGIVYARETGFNAARGDIIARIDVETRIGPEWIARLQHIFADPTVDAVSGSITFHDVPFQPFFAAVDSFFRHYLARNLSRHQQLFLYGGNMAIRRSAWQRVRSHICYDLKLHEDIDLAAHMSGGTYTILFDSTLQVSISARRVDNDFRTYLLYALANSRTYLRHHLVGRFYMYPVIALVVVCYPVLRVLYRSYDHERGRFSLRLLFEPMYDPRISPISE